MSDREPTTDEPAGPSPAALRWSQRMEGQTPRPPGAGGRRRKKPSHGRSGELGQGQVGVPARRRRRKRLGAAGWSAMGAVIVAAAAGVAIALSGAPGDSRAAGTDQPTGAAADSAEETRASEEVPLPPIEPSPSTDAGTVPTDPSVPTTPGGSADLGLSVPVSQPACDGTWLVILGSATDPASYEADLTALLQSNAGAQYTLTEGSCASLRQSLPDGTRIYAAYLGPYPDQAAACAASTGIGNGAYVKRMDDVTPPEQTWEC